MANIHSYRICLTRSENTVPWGFRLEGGTDVGHPLNIQSVTPGSLAERFGLRTGDIVLRINRSETKLMQHEDAKMEIIRSNNDLELVIQRGAQEFVDFYSPKFNANTMPVNSSSHSTIKQKIASTTVQLSSSSNKISPNYNHYNDHQPHLSPRLHAKLETPSTKSDCSIGASHNVSPTPFGQSPPVPGQEFVAKTGNGRVHKIVHSSYNSPKGLYNQKNFNQTFEQTISSLMNTATDQNVNGQPIENLSNLNKQKAMYCGSCGGFIRGVVVKVQGHIPMHPECLKCCKCGIGLRNVGYFYINEQLYCETHAKRAAPPPEPGMKAVVVYK